MKKTLMALLMGLALTACDGREAQSEETITQNKDPTEVCKKLSEENGIEYKVISGKVMATRPIAINGDIDVNGEYPGMYDGRFRAMLLPLEAEDDNQEERFFVYTPIEDVRTLYKKNPYMIVGKNYQFCARGPESFGPGLTGTTYYIDNIETIHELETETQSEQ